MEVFTELVVFFVPLGQETPVNFPTTTKATSLLIRLHSAILLCRPHESQDREGRELWWGRWDAYPPGFKAHDLGRSQVCVT